MPSVITKLCLRDGACVTVCPVDCIVPGIPTDEFPQYYIDPETCIDCSACIPECPHGAIFPDEEVPTEFEAEGGERLSLPLGAPGEAIVYDGFDIDGEPVHLNTTRILKIGEKLDLSDSIKENADFFVNGPGYSALEK